MATKRIKAWTVIWKTEKRASYGVPRSFHGVIVLDDDQHGIKFNASKTQIGRPKMRFADMYPFFDSKQEAEAYRAGNTDWDVVPCTISFTTPTKKRK